MAVRPDVIAEELHNNTVVQIWSITDSPDASPRSKEVFSMRLRTLFATAFLPEGYPDSVTTDYAGFQVWDTVQALCSYVRGMLSGQAILRGIGVGKQAATPLGAVFQFFVRDMTGMAGGVIFAYSQGSQFDACAKQWRIFADVINDIGMTVELASPLFPSLFLPMACFGSIARSMTGVAGGATRAALTQHFAKMSNAADISAKEHSQETMTTIIGMVLGMSISSLAADSLLLAWGIFLLLTWLHILANVWALRSLVLSSLNGPRLNSLLDMYLQQGTAGTPQQLAADENLVPPPLLPALARLGLASPPYPIDFGVSLSLLASGGSVSEVRRLTATAGEHKYIIKAIGGRALVVVHTAAAGGDKLRAYVHAAYMAHLLRTGSAVDETAAGKWMEAHFTAFEQQLRLAGWNLDRVSLPRPVMTARWAVQAAKKEQ